MATTFIKLISPTFSTPRGAPNRATPSIDVRDGVESVCGYHDVGTAEGGTVGFESASFPLPAPISTYRPLAGLLVSMSIRRTRISCATATPVARCPHTSNSPKQFRLIDVLQLHE